MSVEIVAVPDADAELLVPLLHDAEEDDERIRAALRDPACRAYAARLGGETLGAAVVRWDRREPSELLYIAVDPARRGTGVGRRLVAAVQAELPLHGRSLLVGTANCSLDNIAFYQRCGFRMHSVRRDFFAYIQPPLSEHGIPMLDMIVFSYASPTATG
ncbi:GNAT family N-acetyltransferase [Dactylosporangium sp. CA-052675]|uniref:GNAT family N-acetyltransferase n=1 Tax=Dactylosporangium sp. CA-052675 TaxID=3239927 RepID=UPI003D8F4EA7